jgi:hypothetical protein
MTKELKVQECDANEGEHSFLARPKKTIHSLYSSYQLLPPTKSLRLLPPVARTVKHRATPNHY